MSDDLSIPEKVLFTALWALAAVVMVPVVAAFVLAWVWICIGLWSAL